MGVVGYYALGDQAEANVVLNLSPGPVRIVIEIMLLLHLISAFPILIMINVLVIKSINGKNQT